MKTYGKGAKLFIDYSTSKPTAVCVEVVEEGTGKSLRGSIRALITARKDVWRGRVVLVDTRHAVPREHLFRRGGKLRVKTDYQWREA